MAENEDLKTLGDIEDRELERVPGGVEDTLISERALKQAAIAWVCNIRKIIEKHKGEWDDAGFFDIGEQYSTEGTAMISWIMHFFGLTEEDVGE